ncbi:MAG: hypothetical protein ACRDOB_02005 [Streptosporangiaceae bacterium]
MDLFIDRAGRRPGLCAQLYEQIREGITAGRLRAGDLPTGAGLHITARLRPGYDEARVLAAAAELGVATTGLAQHFRARPGEQGLLIGFGAASATELGAAIDALGYALKRSGLG